MPNRFVLLLIVMLLTSINAKSAEPLKVAQDYIDIRTGPGRGYPVMNILERDSWFQIDKQFTSWLKITQLDKLNTPEQFKLGSISGWIHLSDLNNITNLLGNPIDVPNHNFTQYNQDRPWSGSVVTGELSGASLLGVIGSYRFNNHFSLEAALTQSASKLATRQSYNIQLLHHTTLSEKYQPFFLIGTGILNVKPKNTLIRNDDSEDDFLKAGIGLQTHIFGPLFFRLEYSQNVLLTSRKNNEYLNEWSLGFSSYF